MKGLASQTIYVKETLRLVASLRLLSTHSKRVARVTMRGEGPQHLRIFIKSLVVLLTLVMARASKSKGGL